MIDPRDPRYDEHPASPTRPAFTYRSASHRAPLVSIVTPFFQTGSEFLETAASVFGQSLQAFEWIIVDDGSTEADSLAVLEAVARDPRVRVVRHPTNRGPSAARNTGREHARCDLILHVDSDDLLEPTAAEKWFWYLTTHPEAAFVGGYTVAFGEQQHLWARGFGDGAAFLDDNLAVTTAMIRRSVLEEVMGYDTSLRAGLEDWDLWLRCAAAGHWGATVDEYLSWYRRRASHGDRWAAWDGMRVDPSVRQLIRERYGSLRRRDFVLHPDYDAAANLDEPASFNPLVKEKRPRLLLVLPWMVMGGADKFNLDLVEQLRTEWEVTIATTLPSQDTWAPRFALSTPDIFRLHSFLPASEHPRFLSYLIDSRSTDVVLMSNSDFAYGVLPWLRRRHPRTAFLDYCHMEQEDWKNGGYPMRAVESQPQLDLNVVSSEHLKRWMVQRGADPGRIEVCYTNIDAGYWAPDPAVRAAVRAELEIGEGSVMILYSGRICAQKQPRVFFQTIRTLAERGLDFVVAVAGEGEDAPWLRRAVQAHGLASNVRFLGEVTNDRARDLMIATDVFFLPSQWEGIALTMFEAMATGCAVVGANVGGQRELVVSGTGILIEPDTESNEASLYADAITRLIVDPAYRNELAASARALVREGFPLEEMGRVMQETLTRARTLHDTDPRAPADEAAARASAVAAAHENALAAAFSRELAAALDRRLHIRVYRTVLRPARRLQRVFRERGWTKAEAVGRSIKRAVERRLLN